MRERFYVVYVTLRSIFAYWFQTPSHSAVYLSGKSLFQKSFRIPQKLDHSFYFLVIILKQILKKHQQKEPAFISYSNTLTCKHLIYDVQLKSAPLRYNYTKYHSKSDIHGFLAKDNLLHNTSIPDLIGDLIQCFFMTLLLFPYSIINRNKRAISFQILIESIEIQRLYKICKRNKTTKLYFFSTYEKDANLSAHILQNLGIEIYKIPSEVPLCFWNKIIITDTLCICNAYQYDEIEFYKSTMCFNKTEFWGPEMMLNIQDKYLSPPLHTPKQTLGFYSTASWVRVLHGHMDQGVNMEENEHLVKTYLKEYLIMRPNIELIVFLHPKEKKEDMLTLTKKHYQSYFEGMHYQFAPLNQSTADLFAEVNLAIAFNSTVIYERLYFGFKCLIMPLFTGEFPIKTSSLNNICTYSKDELFQKIDQNLNLSPAQFFEQNKLIDYPYYAK